MDIIKFLSFKNMGFPLVLLLGLLGFYLFYPNYLLFHSSVELLSIVVSCAIFMIIWNSKDLHENPFWIFLGIAYLSIGFLDYFDAMSFEGMNIIWVQHPVGDQIWLGTRFIEALSLFLAFHFLRKKKIHLPFIFGAYAIVTLSLLLSVYYYEIFPACFTHDDLHTTFKVFGEIIIVLLFTAALYTLNRNRYFFTAKIYKFIFCSIILSIVSEILCAFHLATATPLNMAGHLFKFFSFYVFYRGVIQTGLRDPYSIILRNLKEEENRKQGLALRSRMDSIVTLASGMAHEINNPLSVILGNIELLKQGCKRDVEAHANILTIQESVSRISGITHKILNYSYASKELRTIDCHEIIQDHVEIISTYFHNEGIKLKRDLKAKHHLLRGSGEYLLQILISLLTNSKEAIKGKKDLKNPTITIRTYNEFNFFILEVLDNGIGYKEEDKEKIFDAFYTTKDVVYGSGLGLYVVQSLTKLMDGFVSLDRQNDETSLKLSFPTIF